MMKASTTQMYMAAVIGYLNLYIWFIRSPFLEAYISVILALGLPILGIVTIAGADRIFPDKKDQYGFSRSQWLTSIIGFLLLALWGQLAFTLHPYLPSWFT